MEGQKAFQKMKENYEKEINAKVIKMNDGKIMYSNVGIPCGAFTIYSSFKRRLRG